MVKNIVQEINHLKKKHNAVILVHNYQIPEVQDIADHLGDSLDLAKKASKTNSDVIVFCGVDFMAESAKILNPNKTVILPDESANCPMANMVNKKDLIELKEKHPNAAVVAYINTTADIKTLADICCTSSNGKKVVENVKENEIIFIPDQNLGAYIQRKVVDKKMILWPGMCATHHNIRKSDIEKLKKKHPKAEVLVHPECRLEIIDVADQALSTNGMINHVKNSDTTEFIIGTEKDICYRLQNENPEKTFYAVKRAVCPNMKKINLEKILYSLKTLEPKVELSEEIMKKAKRPLQKMMSVGRGD